MPERGRADGLFVGDQADVSEGDGGAGDRLVGLRRVAEHHGVPAASVLEVVKDSFEFEQARDKREVRLAVLDAEIADWRGLDRQLVRGLSVAAALRDDVLGRL